MWIKETFCRNSLILKTMSFLFSRVSVNGGRSANLSLFRNCFIKVIIISSLTLRVV